MFKSFKVLSLLTMLVFGASTVYASGLTFGDSEYWVVSGNRISWNDAKSGAEAQGGHLAAVTSVEEQRFIQDSLLSGHRGEFWLGAFQSEDPGLSAPKDNWNWVTGESWDYSNWYRTEANNAGNRDEKYLGIWSKQGWHWNDEGHLGNIKGYVVEKSLNNAPTPVPAAIWLLGAGLAGVFGLRKKYGRS